MSTLAHLGPGVWMAIVCFVIAATIALWFLLGDPPLTRGTKVLLLFGIAVFPVGGAVATGYVGFEGTTHREFCGGCHVMTPYTDDAADLTSKSLASRHSRNPMFGEQSCYKCHANYGMFSTVATKMGGMSHVYYYYLGGWGGLTIDEFFDKVHIKEPFKNSTCMQCHSTRTPYYEAVADHQSAAEDLRTEKVSCASSGCHGPSHPFSKRDHAEGAAHGEHKP